MRDDSGQARRHRAARWWAAAVACLACAPGGVAAQSGYLQGRYERLVGEAIVPRGDSGVTDTTFTRSYWSQSYQLDKTMTLGRFAQLSWQLGFQDRQAVERTERTQAPFGNARLTAPIAGLYLAVRPVTSISLVELGAGGLDSIQASEVRSRTTQTTVTGYLTPSGLPRLDVSWIRDQRGASGFGARTVGERRDARLSQQVGPFSFRAAYGDLGNVAGEGPVRLFQRNFGAGTGLALASGPATSLNLDYDFSGFDRGTSGSLAPDNRTHRGTLNGNWRQSAKLAWNLFGWYQHSTSLRQGGRPFDSGEGQAYGMYQANRALRITSGGQVRRVQQDGRVGAEGMLLASAAMEGKIRQNWTGIVDASRTQSVNPFRAPVGVTTLRGSSRSRLRPGIDLSLDLQGSVSDDTVAAARAVTQGNVGLQLAPLRTVFTTLRTGLYRVGPSLFEAANDSRTGQVDVRWTPLQRIELFGSLRRQSSSIQDQSSTSRSGYARWTPWPILQLDMSYARSSSRGRQALAGAPPPRDRESVTAHATWSLDRARQVSGQMSLMDPGTARRVTAYDATFTWRFWR